MKKSLSVLLMFTLFTGQLSGCIGTTSTVYSSSASSRIASSQSASQQPTSSLSSSQSASLQGSLSLPSNSAPFPKQTVKEDLKTDPKKSTAYNAAIKAYNAFLNGQINAIDKYKTEGTLNINEMSCFSDKPGIGSYMLFDMSGDGIPELHTCSVSYDIFSYQNGQVVLWYEYPSELTDGTPYPLENGALFCVFATTGRTYDYITFDRDGTATTISFFDAATFDDEVVPENAPYYFNDKAVTKEQYVNLTKEYIAMSKKPATVQWYSYDE